MTPDEKNSKALYDRLMEAIAEIQKSYKEKINEPVEVDEVKLTATFRIIRPGEKPAMFMAPTLSLCILKDPGAETQQLFQEGYLTKDPAPAPPK